MHHEPKQLNTATTSFEASAFLHPRFWFTWIGIGLLRLAASLPYPVQLFIGRRLGDLMYGLSPRRRQVARRNLELCFPDIAPNERQRLLRGCFQSVGISVIETAFSWWGSEKRLRNLYRFEGEQHLQSALRQGKGVLLLGGHHTTLEISGRFLAFHTNDLQPIFKPARNPLFNAVVVASRSRLFDKLLSNKEFRTILRGLKDNKVVWYAPDQDFSRGRNVFAPFMGIPATTLTMTSRLAKSSGAPVLPFYSQRLPGSEGYLIKLLPPMADFPGDDDVADAIQINAAIEQQVRKAPEQYLWLHRRFKTRPPGEKEDIYA
jgi:KDO2-lipid IV(A) lauroyltransferase